MNNKKLQSLIMSGVLVIAAAAGFAGCKPDHTHSYTTYYKVNAEQTKAYTFNKCSCGHTCHEQEMASGTYVIVSADATAENYVQKVLNTDINNKTVIFAPGEYTELMELSPSRETATIYAAELDGDNKSTTGKPLNVVDIANVNRSEYYVYERNYENIVFAGTEGAVLKNRIVLFSGSAQGWYSVGCGRAVEKYDPIRETNYLDASTAFYIIQNYNNLKFTNLKFEGANGRLFFRSSSLYVKYNNNFVVDGCSFVTDEPSKSSGANSSSWDSAIFNSSAFSYEYNSQSGYNEENKVNTVTNAIVKNCYVDGHFEGVRFDAMKNITVKDSIFKNTAHNSIALYELGTDYLSGEIIIENNEIHEALNQSIKVSTVTDGNVVIRNNKILNTVKNSADWAWVMQLYKPINTTYEFTNNTFNGVKMYEKKEKNANYNNIYIKIPGVEPEYTELA